MITIYVLAAAAGLSLLWLGRNVRVVKQSNGASSFDSDGCNPAYGARD